MPLAVKPLALAHRLEPERAPVDAPEDAELAAGEGIGGEGEEELVEEGEEEGVEVVARGGEAAVFFFCVCVFVESFFFFSSFPLFSLSPKKLEISLSLFSLLPLLDRGEPFERGHVVYHPEPSGAEGGLEGGPPCFLFVCLFVFERKKE